MLTFTHAVCGVVGFVPIVGLEQTATIVCVPPAFVAPVLIPDENVRLAVVMAFKLIVFPPEEELAAISAVIKI